MVKLAVDEREATLELARVLVVDADPTSRLTLQTVLQASGYRVESAASAAEAARRLEEEKFELVLSDLDLESPKAGLQVLAQARSMPYRPATALIQTYQSDSAAERRRDRPVLIEPEDIPALLTKVAEMISGRASRILHRQLRALSY